MALRVLRTVGVLVWILIPSAAGKEHAGTSPGAPSTSTTHMRQVPEGSRPSMWQMVGTWIPPRWSACRMVSPFLASSFCPFASRASIGDSP